ncbi:hypothetical protein ACSDQ9_12895 [Aestuariimicrobium soli]|uniref:hypothetical protein n=1 Tax=Aestuariimicrobium soli TaxID=2035834 RepID=UPI003EB6B33B
MIPPFLIHPLLIPPLLIPLGILLPQEILDSVWFGVLSTFVSINTVMFLSMAIVKMLPRLHPDELLPRRHTRSETRSIHPDHQESGRPVGASSR